MDAETKARLVDLYRDNYFYIYKKALIFFREPELAQDVAQDVFAKVVSELAKGNRKVLNLPYLVTIATRTCIDRARAERVRGPVNPADPDQIANGKPDAAVSVLLAQLVHKLPSSLREIAVYKYVDGLSLDEMVGLTGLSKRTLQRRIRKIEKKVATFSDAFR